QVAIEQLDAGPGGDVGGDRAEGNFEVGERASLDGAERIQNALEMVPREESRASHVEVDGQVEKAQEDPHEARSASHAGGDLREPRGREPNCIVGADDGAHARAGDHVDGDPLPLEDVEDADVCEPPGGATPEREADAPAGEMACQAFEGPAPPRVVERHGDDVVSGDRGTGAVSVSTFVDEHEAARRG